MRRASLAIGIGFGFFLAAGRLTDYDVIHDMLLLREPDLFLFFGAAIATALPLLWLLERSGRPSVFGGALRVTRERVQRKHVAGALVFGTGWAIAGACPGTALAMPMTGNVLGVLVIAGIFTGQWIREAVGDRIVRLRALPAQS